MTNLALDEQETTFTIEGTDRHTLHVFSNDSVWQARVEKLGIESTKQNGYGKWYKVDLREFSFGIRRKRQLTDEQRAAMRERLASYREDADEEEELELA